MSYKPTKRRFHADRREGVGLGPMPSRDPAHQDEDWFETDKDDQLNDPDTEQPDPLPTERHRTIPNG